MVQLSHPYMTAVIWGPCGPMEVELYMYMCVCILFHSGLLQDVEYSSLCYIVGPCYSPALLIVMCICQSQAPNSFLRLLRSPLVAVNWFSVSVNLLLFCKSVHLCHILDSTYK